MNDRLLVYPWPELCRARDAFSRRWRMAFHNKQSAESAIINRVDHLHRTFPPNINVRNIQIYPFLEADAFRPSRTALISQVCQNTISPPALLSVSSKQKRLRPSEISELTEHALMSKSRVKEKRLRSCTSLSSNTVSATNSEISRNDESKWSKLDKDSSTRFVYRCDNCDEIDELASMDDALSHLIDRGHRSCSQYLVSNLEESEMKVIELTSPRVVVAPTSTSEADFGWKTGDAVVFCPSCHLVMPDKILCAYHHQTRHSNHQPAYGLGRVLKAADLTVDAVRPNCETCGAMVSNLLELAAHWFRKSPTCSPLQSSFSVPHHAVIECLHCGRQRDRTIFPWAPKALQKDGTNIHATKAANFLGEIMLAHLNSTHRPRLPKTGPSRMTLRFRFVAVSEARGCSDKVRLLPAFACRSTSSNLHFALTETERESGLLRSFGCKSSRKALFSQVNSDLDRLNAAIRNTLSH